MADVKKRRLVLVFCAAAIVLSLLPATARACECLDRLWPWNWCRGTAATASTYAPAYSVQYPVAVQTCCYVPQTCYRTVAQTVPTTVYCPSTCCDPCTGCATTCYYPVTSYVHSAQLVPYTAYTPVWTTSCYSPCATVSCAPACCPTSCPSTCGTTYGTTTTSSCGSCGTPAASSTLTPAPMQSAPTETPSSGTPQPSLPSSTTPQTYKQEKPIPPPVPESDDDKGIRESSHNPRLDGPSLDRVTAYPVRTATYRAVSYTDDAAAGFNYGGWRASDK